MANQLSVKIGLDASGFTKGMKDAKDSTAQYTNQVTQLTKDLPNLKRELAASMKETMGLTLAVSRLTKEQKDSAQGRAMIKMLEESKAKTAELKDMAVDTATQIRNMASDTKGLDALKDAVNVAGNSFSALAGTIGLVTGEEDKMKQAVVAFTTVQSTVNALTTVSNALQKESALMTAISTLQTKAKTAAVELETAAEGKNIVATKSATAAQAALNLVADANPYVLLASAIAALVVGYVAFEDEINDLIGVGNSATAMTNKLTKAQQEQAGELAKDMLKVKHLQEEWKELRTEGEKNQWIKDNQQNFQDLGVEVENVYDAENLLVNNTDAFIDALNQRAMAAAATELAAEQYKEALKAQYEAEKEMSNPSLLTKGKALLNMKWGDTYEQSLKRERRKAVNALQREANKAMKEGNKLDEMATNTAKSSSNILSSHGIKEYNKNKDNNKNTNTPKSGGSGKKTETWAPIEMEEVSFKEIKINDNTKKALQAKLNRMQDYLDTNIEMYIDGQINPEYTARLKKIEELQEKINNPKDINSELYDEASKSIANGLKITSVAMQKMDEETKKQKDAVSELKSAGYDALADSAYGLANVIGMVSGEEAGQAAQFAVNTTMMIADCIKQVAAMQAAAMASGTASAAKLPFPANIAAIATVISTILAVFSSLPKFAEGGIVGGASFSGDKVLARVNSGERVLTKKQNDSLENALDNGNFSSNSSNRLYGDVVVKGSDLHIAMTNYDKIHKKSR